MEQTDMVTPYWQDKTGTLFVEMLCVMKALDAVLGGVEVGHVYRHETSICVVRVEDAIVWLVAKMDEDASYPNGTGMGPRMLEGLRKALANYGSGKMEVVQP